jgi:hypothetical protein
MDVALLFAIDGILVLLYCHVSIPADSIHVVSLHFTSLQIDFATLDLDDAVHPLNFFGFLAFTRPSDCTQREPPLPIVSMSHFQTVAALFIPSETDVLPSSVISRFSSISRALQTGWAAAETNSYGVSSTSSSRRLFPGW